MGPPGASSGGAWALAQGDPSVPLVRRFVSRDDAQHRLSDPTDEGRGRGGPSAAAVLAQTLLHLRAVLDEELRSWAAHGSDPSCSPLASPELATLAPAKAAQLLPPCVDAAIVLAGLVEANASLLLPSEVRRRGYLRPGNLRRAMALADPVRFALDADPGISAAGSGDDETTATARRRRDRRKKARQRARPHVVFAFGWAASAVGARGLAVSARWLEFDLLATYLAILLADQVSSRRLDAATGWLAQRIDQALADVEGRGPDASQARRLGRVHAHLTLLSERRRPRKQATPLLSASMLDQLRRLVGPGQLLPLERAVARLERLDLPLPGPEIVGDEEDDDELEER